MAGKLYNDPEIGQVMLVKSGRGRRISIRVHPVKGVTVSIPYYLGYEDGMRFFMQKRGWVVNTVLRQRARLDQAERAGTAVGLLCSGSVVRTLLSEIVFVRDESVQPGGMADPERKAAVRVKTVSVEDVSRTGRLYLCLGCPVSSKSVIYPGTMPPEGSAALSSLLSGVLVSILRDEARSLLPQKLSFLAGRYGFVYNNMAVKHNMTNWGSCSSRGNINLNLNLVRLPEPVCDYVILHELCHLRHPDHGPGFHTLLEKLCEDNMKRLSFLAESMQQAPESGVQAEKDYIRSLISKMRRSRARFPVHHVLEQEVRKYRLV